MVQQADQPVRGYVDFYGYHAAAGGWFLCGWISLAVPEDGPPPAFTLRFDQGDASGQAILCFFDRQDLAGAGRGMVAFVAAPGRVLGSLRSVVVTASDDSATIYPAGNVQQLREQELSTRIRPVLMGLTQAELRGDLLALLARRGYTGADTLAGLADRVLLDVDFVVRCPPDGVVLIGWLLAEAGVIKAVRLRSGPLSTPVPLDAAIRIERPDVIDAVGHEFGFTDNRSGFMVYVGDAVSPGDPTYLEVETASREVGFRNLPEPKLHGMTAIRRILDVFAVQYAEVRPAYDGIIGPAIRRLNDERLRAPPRPVEIRFGRMPAQPRFSVIVTLYGRIDYLEYQMAFFSCHPAWSQVDLIYVLDDPARRNEAERLAESVHERFRIPFRLIALERNLGFAPANNVGLGLARGTFVCFLNSDVFPGTPDWLERLGARLDADRGIGAVGPLLVFEDETVQHEGMQFAPIEQFGGWMFPLHQRKGRRPLPDGGLKFCDAITGACLLMRRAVAAAHGGFDEGFVIGDFEDSDLCLRLRDTGLRIAVDRDVRLFHLERQSQVGTQHRWRMNMTLYNAWRHEQRWRDKIGRWQATTGAA
jgi:GT2 family glycosyltransferase